MSVLYQLNYGNSIYRTLITGQPEVKEIVHPKSCHYLVTLMSFHTCLTFFLLWNANKDILKTIGN